MDPKIRPNLSLNMESKVEPIRRLIRRQELNQSKQLTRTEESAEKSCDTSSALYLEMFCFNSSLNREKHFIESVRTGDQFSAKIVSKLDSNSFSLKLLQNKSLFLNDLSLANVSVVLTTSDHKSHELTTDDIIVVVVLQIRREQKKIFCQFVSKVDTEDNCLGDNSSVLKNFSNISFEKYIKTLNEFRNPFVLNRKPFSSLLLTNFNPNKERKPKSIEEKDKPLTQSSKSDTKYAKSDKELNELKTREERNQKKKKKKEKRSRSDSSSSSASSSSSSTSSSTSSSSDSSDEKKHKKRRHKSGHKKHKKVKKNSDQSSKRFSFVISKSSSSKTSSAVIPGLSDDRPKDDQKSRPRYLSDKMIRQLKKDEEIERKIHLLAKTLHK